MLQTIAGLTIVTCMLIIVIGIVMEVLGMGGAACQAEAITGCI